MDFDGLIAGLGLSDQDEQQINEFLVPYHSATEPWRVTRLFNWAVGNPPYILDRQSWDRTANLLKERVHTLALFTSEEEVNYEADFALKALVAPILIVRAPSRSPFSFDQLTQINSRIAHVKMELMLREMAYNRYFQDKENTIKILKKYAKEIFKEIKQNFHLIKLQNPSGCLDNYKLQEYLEFFKEIKSKNNLSRFDEEQIDKLIKKHSRSSNLETVYKKLLHETRHFIFEFDEQQELKAELKSFFKQEALTRLIRTTTFVIAQKAEEEIHQSGSRSEIWNLRLFYKVLKIDLNDRNRDGIPHAFFDPITLEILKDPQKAPCGHVFSKVELKGWLKENPTCPCCREAVSEVENATDVADAIEKFRILRPI